MALQLLTPALDVYGHMALDEVTAHQQPAEPVLRFYHWMPGPAVTFGYSQFYVSVRGQTRPEQGPLCRRPTGGGMVFHGEDLTFSLVFHSVLSPRQIYAQLHGSLERALAAVLHPYQQGAVAAQAYAPQQNGAAAGCFARPVEHDLLAGGKKILGGAIRRFAGVVLYQGSLQCAAARTNPAFRRAVAAGAADLCGTAFAPEAVPGPWLQQARELAQSQYGNAVWTEKF